MKTKWQTQGGGEMQKEIQVNMCKEKASKREDEQTNKIATNPKIVQQAPSFAIFLNKLSIRLLALVNRFDVKSRS
jgi:hypothetical protein